MKVIAGVESQLTAEAIRRLVVRFNLAAVSVYKVLGFALLAIIALGMAGYLCLSAFYIFSSSWAVPLILSPTHERVLTAQTLYLEQRYKLQKLEAERVAMDAEIAHLSSALKAHEDFTVRFLQAVETERGQMRTDLGRLQDILRQYRTTGSISNKSLRRFRQRVAADLDARYRAGLIDSNEHIKGKMLLHELDTNLLTEREKLATLESRTEQLEAELNALEGEKGTLLVNNRVPFEAVMREEMRLRVMVAESDLRTRLVPVEAQVEGVDLVLADLRRSVARLSESAYVRAAQGDKLTIAFVPYANLRGVQPGLVVHMCYLEFVACRQAGKVVSILEGEVQFRHPVSGRDLRGQMVEVGIKELRWAEARSLILGRPPFFL